MGNAIAETSRHGKSILTRTTIHLAIIAVLGLLIYANTINVPFQWDEETFIAENPIIKDLNYFLKPSEAQGMELYGALKSRYIGYLSFGINYALHGLDPRGYHLLNIIIHITNALILYMLVLLTFRTPFLARGTLAKQSKYIALFSGLFFVAHPVQTEAVTYIFQRLASLVTFFYLLSIVTYIRSRLSPNRYAALILYIVSLVSAVLAMKTKENAFTLPIVIVLYEFLFFDGPVRKRMVRMVPLLLTLLIIPLTLSGIGNPVGEVIGGIVPATRGYHGLPRIDYLLTEFRVIVTYLRLLVLPVNQNLDYDYTVYRSLLDLPVILSFLFHCAMLAVAFLLLHRSRAQSRDLRLISFGIFWFYITLSVESSIVPIPMVIDEYRLYLPSAGVFGAFLSAVFLLREKLEQRRRHHLIIVILVFISLLFAVATVKRNTVWLTKVSLWEDVVRKSPSLVYARINLGVAYMEMGRLDEAAREFIAAVQIKPDHESAFNNLGMTYFRQGRIKDAEGAFQRAVRIKPDYAKAHNNLGTVYAQQQRFDEAMEEFQRAVTLKPDLVDAYNNIGNIYMTREQYHDAEKAFRTAIGLSPEYPKAYYNMGLLYEIRGQKEQALMEYRRALHLDPGYVKARSRMEELSK